MWHNAIGRRIRRDNRWLRFWGLVFSGLALYLLWLLRLALYNFLAGPSAISHQDLSTRKKTDDDHRLFVTFEAAKRIRTGFTVQSSKSSEPHAEYVLVPVQDRFLLLKTPFKDEGATVTGEIRSLDSEERDRIVNRMDRDTPGLKSHLLPFVVDTQSKRLRVRVFVGLPAVLLLGSLGLFWSVRALNRSLWPERHPLARALARFGTPSEVAKSIEGEKAGTRRLRLGSVEILGRWLVFGSLVRCYKVFRLDDLVWVYKMIFRINGIPSYLVKVFDRLGESFQAQDREVRIDGIIAALAILAPWLIVGFDQRLEDLWRSDPAALIAAVQQRQQEHLQPVREDEAPAEPEQPPG